MRQGTIFVLYGCARSLETKPFLYGNREGRIVLTRVVSPANKAQAAPRGVMAAHIKTWQKSLSHVLSKEVLQEGMKESAVADTKNFLEEKKPNTKHTAV